MVRLLLDRVIPVYVFLLVPIVAGHYETWDHWRRDRTINPALRALVRSYESEDCPRGRIVFDRSRGFSLSEHRNDDRARDMIHQP